MSEQLAWGVFVASILAIWFAGWRLTRAADAIALRTGLGRVFIGSVLLAATTSLPEVALEAAAAWQNFVDIALGNVFGSNIFNMTIISVCGIVWGQGPLLAAASRSHIATAVLGMLLSAIAALAILTRPNIGLLGIGVEIFIILAVYAFGLYILRKNNLNDASANSKNPTHPTASLASEAVAVPEATAVMMGSMARVWVEFLLSAIVVFIAAAALSKSADVIGTATGLGGTFIGTTLVAATTSIPEVVTSIVAARIGAIDLAVGNVLGSNIFNMSILLVSDIFYRGGYILSAGSPTHAITALVGLLLSGLVALGLISPIPGRIRRVSLEALLILVAYFLGAYLVFLHRFA